MPKTARVAITAIALIITGAGAVGTAAHPTSVRADAGGGTQQPDDMTWG